MVGMAGFEPTTTTPPVWCATKLRYIPAHIQIDYIYVYYLERNLIKTFNLIARENVKKKYKKKL